MRTILAVSGDAILNRQVSVCEAERFRSLIEQFRAADVGFTHLEMNLLDYDDPNVYPAAEAGGTWMRAPPAVAAELAWAGIDIVSHASNHALDYGYGGLESTWAALEDADVDWAGTGRALAAARAPTHRETPGGRVACVSMTTSFTRWSRAGEARRDMQGRPGVNPLGYQFELGPERTEQLLDLAEAIGLWVIPDGDDWLLNPPGLHNTVYRFHTGEEPGARPVLAEDGRAGNLQSVREADRQADRTIAHVHTHAWKTDSSDGSARLPSAVRAGMHRRRRGRDGLPGFAHPLRGIETYGDGVVFYEPGDLFMMSDTTERLPSEFYDRYGDSLERHPADAMPGRLLAERGLPDLFDAAADADNADYGGAVRSPEGGYFSGAVLGAIVPVCTFENGLERVELHPARLQGGRRCTRASPSGPRALSPVASLSTWTSSRRRSGLISRSRTASG